MPDHRAQAFPRRRAPSCTASRRRRRIKINPLTWEQPDRLQLEERKWPRHPLVFEGYLSIGCTTCTAPVAPGEGVRAGRWRGQDKTECGIHCSDRTAQ
jgi:phosphoadenosine phosphosulfate reductase